MFQQLRQLHKLSKNINVFTYLKDGKICRMKPTDDTQVKYHPYPKNVKFAEHRGSNFYVENIYDINGREYLNGVLMQKSPMMAELFDLTGVRSNTIIGDVTSMIPFYMSQYPVESKCIEDMMQSDKNKEKFTGIYKKFDPNGTITHIDSIQNGKYHGLSLQYDYLTGELTRETQNFNNFPHGKEIYYDNLSEYNWNHGKRDGIQRTFYDNGDKRSVTIYDNGQITELIVWYMGGNVQQHRKYSKEFKDRCEVYTYYENKNKCSKYNLFYNKYDGEFILWHPNGQLAEKSYWQNGKIKSCEKWNEMGEKIHLSS